MENATKGLMIAAAILIAIIIIGFGVFLVNYVSDFIQGRGAGALDDLEIQAFNRDYQGYEGVQKGSEIRALIQKVHTHNLKCINEGTTQELGVKIVFEPTNADDTALEIDPVEYAADNTGFSAKISSLRQDVNTARSYTVSLTPDAQGLYREIKIN